MRRGQRWATAHTRAGRQAGAVDPAMVPAMVVRGTAPMEPHGGSGRTHGGPRDAATKTGPNNGAAKRLPWSFFPSGYKDGTYSKMRT